jgi:hypothetical protein
MKRTKKKGIKNKAAPMSMPATIGRMMFITGVFYREDEWREKLL